MIGRILIVEDDDTFRGLLATILEDAGHLVTQAVDGKAGLARLHQASFDLVLSDLKMPKMGGIELFQASRIDMNAPPFVLITAFGTVEEAVAAIKDGVSDFLTKPLKDPDTLRALVARLLTEHCRERRLAALDEAEMAGLPPLDILFAGKAMAKVRWLVGEVATTEATVLIGGESGTGKELLARYIHLCSPRKRGPFVAVNCAAIPENLLESELFGHEKGAFTGAIRNRVGRFELAQGGTIFLDEIGDMSPALQVKVLRVIQEKQFERIGGVKTINADVRIITATNQNLEKAVQEKRFREDLFYRINVIPVHLPPLRERGADIPIMANHFLQKFNKLKNKNVTMIKPEAMDYFMRYPWPGNVRELENLIEMLVVMKEDGDIGVDDIPTKILNCGSGGYVSADIEMPAEGICFNDMVCQFEKELLLKALKKSGGIKNRAAKYLNLNRTTLVEKLKRFNMIEGG